METVSNLFDSISNFLTLGDVQVNITEAGTMVAGQAGRNFYRLGGISGACAELMAGYGAHNTSFTTFKTEVEQDERQKGVFEWGNKTVMHLLHSLGLLAVPLAKKPQLVGYTMTTGMVLFCGTFYYQAFTGDDRPRHYLGRYGAGLLMISWLMMAL